MIRMFLALSVLSVLSAPFPQIGIIEPDSMAQQEPSGTPALPRQAVNTALPDVSKYAKKTVCKSGCDFGSLTEAISSAGCGTLLSLRAGETFVASEFKLPAKPCDESHWVILESDAAQSLAPGVRVSPTDASKMPKIVSNSTYSPIESARGANHYRFIGLEFSGTADGFNSLLQIGADELNDTSTRIIVDRCYLHGGAKLNSTRGIAMRASDSAVIDSYVSEIHSTNSGDIQAIWVQGSNRGPYLIQNNHLESAGENVLFGGGGPGNVLDATITKNWFYKPLTWNPKSPSFGGIHWQLKNSLEFKTGIRVLVEGNVFENCWADAQGGAALTITPRSSQDRGALVDDLTIRDNIITHAAYGFTVQAWDNEDRNWNYKTMGVELHRVAIYDNLFEDLGSKWTSDTPFAAFNYFSGPVDLHINHNTFLTDGIAAKAAYPPKGTGCQFNDNILNNGSYGWESADGTASGTGTPSLNASCADWQFKNNALVGGPGGSEYPKSTRFPANWGAVKFVSFNGGANGDYRLCEGPKEPAPICTGASPLHKAASDGADVGADIVKVMAATEGVRPKQ